MAEKKAGDLEVGDQVYGGWITKVAHIRNVVLVRLEHRREAVSYDFDEKRNVTAAWGVDAGVDFFDSGELVEVFE
jgi:hypothetical protein